MRRAIKQVRTLVNTNVWVQLITLLIIMGLFIADVIFFITRPYIDKNKEIFTVIAVSIVVVCFATVMLINNHREVPIPEEFFRNLYQ